MTIVSDRGLFTILLALFAILWASFCINWYVCGVKGFCEARPVVTTQTLATQPVATEERPQVACAPLITTDIIRGVRNDARDVARLQQFLDAAMGESLSITGIYTVADEAAVRRYQAAFASQILTPWGISQPTGRVQQTTRAAINAQYCAHQADL